MPRKNLKISAETYDLLVEHKDGRTWDAFLSDLVEDDETVSLSSEQVEEIVSLVSVATAEEVTEHLREGNSHL